MEKEHPEIHSSTSCPEREVMLDYLAGRLPGKEAHRLEKHVLDCPFCEDALEGLEMIAEKNRTEALEETDLTIDAIVNDEEEALPKVLFPWRMAAAIVLLLASTTTLWIILPKQKAENIYSEQFESYPAPESTSRAEVSSTSSATTTSENKPSVPPADQQAETAGPVPPTMNDAPAEALPPVVESAEAITGEDPAEALSSGGMGIAESSVACDVETSLAEEEDAPSKEKAAVKSAAEQVPARAMTEKKTAKARPAVKEENLFENGMMLYRQQRYEEALRFFRNAPGTPENSFYSGMCLLELKKSQLALDAFNAYLKSEDQRYREVALWYLALTEVRLRKNQDARLHLEQLVRMNGEYAAKAEELLKTL